MFVDRIVREPLEPEEEDEKRSWVPLDEIQDSLLTEKDKINFRGKFVSISAIGPDIALSNYNGPHYLMENLVLGKQIGAGAFSTVLEAKSPNGETVAVKVHSDLHSKNVISK